MFFLKNNSLLKTFSTTFKSRGNLYNIMKYKDLNEPGVLLYESKDLKTLKENDPSKIEELLLKQAQEKYGQLIPFFIEKALYGHAKHFVTTMHHLPKAESLKLDCLGPNGFYRKFVDLKNIIPVCWDDYRVATRRNLFLAPTFIDNDMIYFNTNQDEFYVFDKESVWNEEGINHSAFDLAARFNEKQWLDYLKLV